MSSDVPVYILAGGQSRRFGSDKARALLGGVPLVKRVAAALGPSASGVAVVGTRAGQYEDLGLTTIADRVGGLGPMGGLSAALMDRKRAAGPGWVALVSCDWLNPSAAWLTPLRAAATGGTGLRLAAAYRGERWDPLPGRYHTDLLPRVDAMLAGGAGAMWRLLEAADALAVTRPAELGELTQANTAEALSRAALHRGDPLQ